MPVTKKYVLIKAVKIPVIFPGDFMRTTSYNITKTRPLTTRQITMGGLFLALSMVLASTGWGMIAIPTPAGAVTTMHLPVILAGILGGPFLGGCAGFAFGLFAWQRFPAFDPVVHILPRILIGIFSWAAFRASMFLLQKVSLNLRLSVSAMITAAAGTLTNTVGVLSIACMHGYFTQKAAITIGFAHGLPELLLAVSIAPPVICSISRLSEVLWPGDNL